MKYLGLLSFLTVFNSFAQKEIFLQTNPHDQYVVAYTTNSYVILFAYQNVLDEINDPELRNAFKDFMDGELSTQEIVEFNKKGQNVVSEEKQVDLEIFFEWYILGSLMHSGNAIILDFDGKPTVSSILYTKEPMKQGGYKATYTDPASGKTVLAGERQFKITGCPSF